MTSARYDATDNGGGCSETRILDLVGDVPRSARLRAALLTHGPRACLAGRLAAELHGLQGMPRDDPTIWVGLLPNTSRLKRRAANDDDAATASVGTPSRLVVPSTRRQPGRADRGRRLSDNGCLALTCGHSTEARSSSRAVHARLRAQRRQANAGRHGPRHEVSVDAACNGYARCSHWSTAEHSLRSRPVSGWPASMVAYRLMTRSTQSVIAGDSYNCGHGMVAKR